MDKTEYDRKLGFAKYICPMPNNFCDGTPIMDRDNPAPKLELCPWYKKGCKHYLKLMKKG